MNLIELKRPSLVSPEDKRMILESLDELRADIESDKLVQLAYIGFTSDGECVYGYCGADVEPYRLAGALSAQSQSILFSYHVADEID